MINKIKILFIFTLLCTGLISHGQDIFDAANSKKYGDHLFKSKEFLKAAMEYERSCFLDSQNWDTHLKLLQCYRKSGQYNRVFSHYDIINSRLPLANKSLFDHEKNISIFQTKPSFFISKTEKDSIAELNYFKTPALLLTNNWKESQKHLVSNDYKTDKTLMKYNECCQLGLKLKYKKPWLAGTMSGIIPGTGKMYSGYYKDGIIAFIMTGLSTYQAYRGYNSKGIKSGIFIIYTGMATGFYLGNIYGSIKAAKQKNRKMNEDINKKTRAVFYEWAE